MCTQAGTYSRSRTQALPIPLRKRETRGRGSVHFSRTCKVTCTTSAVRSARHALLNMTEDRNNSSAAVPPAKPGILRLSIGLGTGVRGTSSSSSPSTAMAYPRRASSSELAAKLLLDDIDVSLYWQCFRIDIHIVGRHKVLIIDKLQILQCGAICTLPPTFHPMA